MQGKPGHLTVDPDARPPKRKPLRRRGIINPPTPRERKGPQGRPPNPIARIRNIIEQAREIGQGERLNNLRLWLDIRNNPGLPWSERRAAAECIEERYGQPRQTVQIAAALEMEGAKLVEFVGYAPPPGWDGDETPAPADTNGNGKPSLAVVEGNGDAPIAKAE